MSSSITPGSSVANQRQNSAGGYDHLIKLLLIGDSGVGKSCLLLRFCDDSFTPSFITTIGIDFKIRTVNLDGRKIKLQIWDTAGQERFQTITTAYYRNAMGILLVYDVTDERSFNNICKWIRNIDKFATEGVNKILIGNKCDAVERRVVETERGAAFAKEYGLEFMETSAKTNVNVDSAFFSLARDIKKRLIDNAAVLAANRVGGGIDNAGNSVGRTVSIRDDNTNQGGTNSLAGYLSSVRSSCCGGSAP